MLKVDWRIFVTLFKGVIVMEYQNRADHRLDMMGIKLIFGSHNNGFTLIEIQK